MFLSIGNIYARENWTGEIKWVNTYENGAAAIYIDNPREGPVASLNCDGAHLVYLGVKNEPAKPQLLSLAITAYTTKNTIRFGIRKGTDGSCEAEYISAR